jgi:hypothetical protein
MMRSIMRLFLFSANVGRKVQTESRNSRSGIETPSLPPIGRCYSRSFTFYVPDPSATLKLVRFPWSLAPTLVALPCMSLVSVAPLAQPEKIRI